MCGRYAIYDKPEVLERRFHATLVDPTTYQPHFNASPSQRLPIIRNDRPSDIVLGFWGFVPSWGYEGMRMSPAINARGETVADVPMFRDAFARRRCLVLVNGFYEWELRDRFPNPPALLPHRSDGHAAVPQSARAWSRARQCAASS